MPHPSEAVLIAFADEELDAGARHEVSAHMDGCGLCRRALRDLREATGALKVEAALVDAGEPAAWRHGATVRPGATDEATPASLPRGRTPLSFVGAGARRTIAVRRSVRTMRWAAIFLVFVGGAAAAMTAPRWRAFLAIPAGGAAPTRVAANPASASGAATVPAAIPLAASASAAVSVLPIDGEAVVSLVGTASARDARVVVRASDRRDVQVTVTTPMSAPRVPRFLTGDGRLEVQLAGDGSVVEVDFPATLRRARVTHDGHAVVTVREGVVLPARAATAGVTLLGARE